MPVGPCGCNTFDVAVGIGTVSPAAMLHINNQVGTALRVDFTAVQNGLELWRDNHRMAYMWRPAGGELIFGSETGDGTLIDGFRFVGGWGVAINAGLSVGNGATIAGTTNLNGVVNVSGTLNANAGLIAGASGGVLSHGPIASDSGITAGTTVTAGGAVIGYGINSVGSTGMLSFGVIQSGVAVGSSPSEGHLRVATTNGSSSVCTWDIGTSQTDNRNLVIRDLDSGVAAVKVQPGTGNVGIGLASGTQPAFPLHVNGTAAVAGIVVVNSGAQIYGPVTVSDVAGGAHGGLVVAGQDGVYVAHQLRVDELLTANGGIQAAGNINLNGTGNTGNITASGSVSANGGVTAGSPQVQSGLQVYGLTALNGAVDVYGSRLRAHAGIDAEGGISALSGGISTAANYDFDSGGKYRVGSRTIGDSNGCYYA